MKNFKILFIVAACTLNLVPLDASAFEIYYFDHPTCARADYKGDVLEFSIKKDVYGLAFGYQGISGAGPFMEKFVEDVKTNVALKFGANIICGGRLESSYHVRTLYSTNGKKDRTDLFLTFTGTAMKTT